MPKDTNVLPIFEKGVIALGEIPKFVYEGNLQTELGQNLTAAEARWMLEIMLAIRYFEDVIVRLKNNVYTPYEGFNFTGATHLSIGQEAVAVGTMAALRPDDYITSTHRGHGHSIAKGAYALLGRDKAGLCEFLGLKDSPEDRDTLLDRALQLHFQKTFAELFGKEEGYCRGRGGGMHIAEFNTGHLGANAIVGGSLGIATGAAIACEKLKNGKIVACLAGDGAANNGIWHESLNMASMSQFKNGTPVIYIIENNQYGMTGQQVGEVTGIDYLGRRGCAYKLNNMHAEIVNGMDVLAVWDAVKRAADRCRHSQGPVLLDCLTYRYMGHSLSDKRTSYRTKEEEEAWLALDPLKTFPLQMQAAGLMTAEEIEATEKRIQQRMVEAAEVAARWTDPDPATIYEGLFSETTSEQVPAEFQNPPVLKKPRQYRRDSEGKILYRHAVCEALIEEMQRDRRVICFGEDIADYGGAFQVTVGLLEAFGRDRVFNTAISEAAICGAATGAAMVGLRPVAEIMYIDFILQAMDQVGNQAAKTRYMFGGKATIPMVIRTTVGGGKGYAGQHSQSLEAVVAHFPGLKVVAPGTAYDAKGLLKSSIRDDNPVIFIEHQLLYTERDVVPEEEYTIPLGVARIHREGADVTVVAYSYMLLHALTASERAAEEGISVEVVDPRTLVPLDVETLVASARKTGRVVLVNQAPSIGCYSEHIAFEIQKAAFSDLKAPMQLVAAHNVPPPMSQTLETEHLPSPEKVLAAIRRVMQG